MTMMRSLLTSLMIVAPLLVGQTRAVEADGSQFEVTGTNFTRGQTSTRVLVASHRAGVTLFPLGTPASPQLATLAEEGDTAPLTTLLLSTPGVRDVRNSGAPPAGFVGPGQSKTIIVDAGG